MRVISACEEEAIPHMVTGALAFNLYGVPRATKDVDFVIDVTGGSVIGRLIRRLEPGIVFGDQVQFDTLTWGKRHIGRAKGDSALQVELFELFDDPFVQEQFRRRRKRRSLQLKVETWVPTAEDMIVQKIRWARSKDLDDARDILAVQGPESLDLAYIRQWTDIHRTSSRLDGLLTSLPDL